MKKVLLSVFALAVLGVTTAAAQIGVGLKAGANIANQTYSSGDFSTKSILGYYGGGFVNIGFGGNLSIQPELLFSAQGSKFETGTIESKTLVDYVNLPVVVQYQIFNGFKIEVGGQVGYAVNGSITGSAPQTKDLDAGLVGGISFKLPLNGLGIDARYNAGLVNLNDESSTPSIKNGVFGIGLHYRFF